MQTILPAEILNRQIIPLLGKISAGLPIDAVAEGARDDLISMLTTPGRYALKVCGDSMIDAGIYHDDTIIVQSQQTALDGDIVVALIDRETVTLKRIKFLPDGQIKLIADNPASENLVYAADRVTIQGKVIGQLRRYL